MTKSIIVVGFFALAACSEDADGPTMLARSAPADANGVWSEPKMPTTKSGNVPSAPVAGDPSLRQNDTQTTFIPLLNWSFEEASPDCNGWPVIGADDPIRAVPAKSGSYSCKVCSNGMGSNLGVTRDLGAVAKGHYSLSAYVRKRATNTAPAQAMARIEGAIVMTSPAVDVSEEWTRVQTEIDISEDQPSLKITVGSDVAEAQNCLFVDDVVFTQAE